VAREIVSALILRDTKSPWYIDLLNLTLGTHDLAEAKRRIHDYMTAFDRDGTRVTKNLDFELPLA
jgi:malate synthase